MISNTSVRCVFLIRFPPKILNPIEFISKNPFKNFLKISAPFQSPDAKFYVWALACHFVCKPAIMSQCWFSYIIIDPLIILLCTLVVRFLVRFFNCMVTDDDHVTNIRYGFVAQFGRYDVIGDSDVLLRVSIKISKGKKFRNVHYALKNCIPIKPW